MEVGPQEADFDFLVRDVEAAGVPVPLATDAQTNRPHHLARLGVSRAVPVRPQLSVVQEPGPVAWVASHVVIHHQAVRASLRGECSSMFCIIGGMLLGET